MYRGDGFWDIQEAYNRISRETLQKYGDLAVEALELRRHPIPSAISSALKYVTGNKIPYDTLYHLSIICSVKGAKVIVEKNETINISSNFGTANDDEHLSIPMNAVKFTISEMLEKTRKRVGDKTFWSYSAFGNNCQNFTQANLISVNMYTPDAKKFVYQDLKELIKHTPVFIQKVANATTYVASLWNKLTGGKKEEIPRHLAMDFLHFCRDNNMDEERGFDEWIKTLDPRIRCMIK